MSDRHIVLPNGAIGSLARQRGHARRALPRENTNRGWNAVKSPLCGTA
jgi:hypothetical protein